MKTTKKQIIQVTSGHPDASHLGSRTGVRFALQIWLILSIAVVLFAGLATLCVSLGAGENQSLVLSFTLSGTFAVVTLSLLKNRQGTLTSSARLSQRSDEVAYTSFRRLLNRLQIILAGASALDIAVDLMRILGIIGLASAVFIRYGTDVFSLYRGVSFSVIFFFSLGLILFHEFVYPFVRRESIWETQYRYREMLMASAINNIVSASITGVDAEILSKTEKTVLQAIKSFLEFAVLDKKRNHFNVNLLVENPSNPEELVCIQRSNQSKPIPTFYKKIDMPTAVRVLKEQNPIYVSLFIPSIKNKDYRMVWQIPVILPIDNIERVIGIIAIDSTTPHHLDFEDNRSALMLNLMPYIALIRFSLAQRWVQDIWDDILEAEQVMGHPHLQSGSEEEVKKYMEYIEDAFRFDRNLDKESLDAALENEDNTKQVKTLEEIVSSLPEATTGRKAFSALFPYVESNNRRIHS